MEFAIDHVTNQYLYPDRYIKMIPYFLNNNTFCNILLYITQTTLTVHFTVAHYTRKTLIL
jgi:hypothetical protein